MIAQVAAVGNARMLLAIQSDGPVQIYDVQHYFPAIRFSGYNGQSQGEALADLIFGHRTPAAIWTSHGTRTTPSCCRSRTTP
jgi:beta-glucosidase